MLDRTVDTPAYLQRSSWSFPALSVCPVEPKWQQVEIVPLTTIETTTLSYEETHRGDERHDNVGKPPCSLHPHVRGFSAIEPCACIVCRECLQTTLQHQHFDGTYKSHCVVCKGLAIAILPLYAQGLQPQLSPTVSTRTATSTDSPVTPLTPMAPPSNANDVLPYTHPLFPPRVDRNETSFAWPAKSIEERPAQSSIPHTRGNRSPSQQRYAPAASRKAPSIWRLRWPMVTKLQPLFQATSSDDKADKEPSWPIVKLFNFGFDLTVLDVERLILSRAPGTILASEHGRGAAVHIIVDAKTAQTCPTAYIELADETNLSLLLQQPKDFEFRGRRLTLKSVTTSELLCTLFPYTCPAFLAPEQLYGADGSHTLPYEFRRLVEMAHLDQHSGLARAPSERIYRCFASLLTVWPWRHILDAGLTESIFDATITLAGVLSSKVRDGCIQDAGTVVSALLRAVSTCPGFRPGHKIAVVDYLRWQLALMPEVWLHWLDPAEACSLQDGTDTISPDRTPIETVLALTKSSAPDIREHRQVADIIQQAEMTQRTPEYTPLINMDTSTARAALFPLPPLNQTQMPLHSPNIPFFQYGKLPFPNAGYHHDGHASVAFAPLPPPDFRVQSLLQASGLPHTVAF